MRAWGRAGSKGSYWKRYCHCRRVSGGFGSSSLWTASKIVPESLPNSIAFGQRLCIVRCLPGGGLNPPPTTTYTHLPPSPPPQPLYRPAMAERYGGVEWRGWILVLVRSERPESERCLCCHNLPPWVSRVP